MDEKKMIDDLVKMLDSGMTDGVGHVTWITIRIIKNQRTFRPWAVRTAPELR